jgi:hypothetical protein
MKKYKLDPDNTTRTHTYIHTYFFKMIMFTPALIALAKSLPPLCEDFSWSSDTAWASQMEALSEEAPL